MPLRRWRWGIVVGVLLIASAAPASQVSSLPEIQITLSSTQEHWRAPLMEAAQQAASIAQDWLGPHLTGTIEIKNAPPFWQGAGAMTAERQVAWSVIRSWWPSELADDHAELLFDAMAKHLEGHAIEQLFDRRYLRRAYRAESTAYFGNHVIWSFPSLRLPRRPDRGDRYATVFAMLERWLGQPALQAAMTAVTQLPPNRINGANIMTTISSAAGQDLSWAFITASEEAPIDYAVTDLNSAAGSCSSPCFDTNVTVSRRGPLPISGRATPRVGKFESGDALTLRVSFENGAQVDARWDGRDESRSFRFQGPAPAVAAIIDPDRVVALDENLLNNAIVRPTATNVPVRKWVARWIVWMQNTVLTYGFFA